MRFRVYEIKHKRWIKTHSPFTLERYSGYVVHATDSDGNERRFDQAKFIIQELEDKK